MPTLRTIVPDTGTVTAELYAFSATDTLVETAISLTRGSNNKNVATGTIVTATGWNFVRLVLSGNGIGLGVVNITGSGTYDAVDLDAIDWNQIANPTSTASLSGTTVANSTLVAGATTVVLSDGSLTAAKIGADAITAAKIADGAIDAATFAAGAINAAAIASDAITDAKVASDVTIASVTGSVGSVATGGITAASFAAGAIDATAIATDAIGANEVSAGAVTKIQSGLATPTNITSGIITTVSGNVTGSVGSISGITFPANFQLLSIDASGYVTFVNTIRPKKNTAYSGFSFPMYDTSGTLTAGLTVTAVRSLDGAAQAACTNSVSSVSGGQYKLDLSTSDTNGNDVYLAFSASGAKTTVVKFTTQP